MYIHLLGITVLFRDASIDQSQTDISHYSHTMTQTVVTEMGHSDKPTAVR